MDQLIHSLCQTFVVDAQGTQKAAEQSLKEQSTRDGFAPDLLAASFNYQGQNDDATVSVRLAAALYLKNGIKACWDPEHADHIYNDNDKAIIRTQIFNGMLSCTPAIRRVLSEAISLICAVDFPETWGEILTSFCSCLQQSQDLDSIDAALSTAHSVFKRYRMHEEVTASLKDIVLEINRKFTGPLLAVMENLLADLQRPDLTEAAAEKDCTILCLAVEAFYDTTYMTLGDEHEKLYPRFQKVFLAILQFYREDIAGSAYTPGVLFQLKSLVVEALTMHLERFDEDMGPYVQGHMHQIWEIVSAPQARAESYDDVVVRCLEFVKAVARGPQYQMLQDPAFLATICDSVILPNLSPQESDMDLLADEPDAFISKVVEGSNSHTRRKAAMDLIANLLSAFEQSLVPIFAARVQELVQAGQNTADGEAWMKTVVAMTVASAVSLPRASAQTQRGAAALQPLTGYIDLKQFFLTTVVPQLSPPSNAPGGGVAPNDVGRNMLVIEAIRFVTMFRVYLSEYFGAIIETLIVWVTSESWVVSSLAAHCLERILCVTTTDAQHAAGNRNAPSSQDRVVDCASLAGSTVVEKSLENICVKLNNNKRPSMYLMLAVMRVCLNLKASVAPLAGSVVQCMSVCLERAAKNPTNPQYNHAMFETLSACVSLAPEHFETIENMLWDSFMAVLTKDIAEFVPYTLQIMAQLVDCHTATAKAKKIPSVLPQRYTMMIAPLLSPEMFQQTGSVPATVRLITAILRCDTAPLLAQPGQLQRLLEIFENLVFLKLHDHDGFNILTTLVLALPYENGLDQYMKTIYSTLFRRLQRGQTLKFNKCLILFFSVMMIHHGVERVVSTVNSIQNGLYWMFVRNIVGRDIHKLSGELEKKLVTVGFTRFILESANAMLTVNDNNLRDVWFSVVFNLLKFLHSSTADKQAEHKQQLAFFQKMSEQVKDTVGEGGFNSVFCPLICAEAKPVDVCEGMVMSPGDYFKSEVQQLMRNNNVVNDTLRQGLQQEHYQMFM